MQSLCHNNAQLQSEIHIHHEVKLCTSTAATPYHMLMQCELSSGQETDVHVELSSGQETDVELITTMHTVVAVRDSHSPRGKVVHEYCCHTLPHVNAVLQLQLTRFCEQEKKLKQ